MKFKFIFLVFVTAIFLFSCRSTKEVTARKEIPNIAENKLLKEVYNAEPEFNTLYAKRLDVSLSHNGKSNSLKGILKIKKDSFIQLSLSAPLGIEVARILLTPDSIKFVDSYHKKYFLTDYNYFSDKFDIDLGFDCVEKILTNTFFNFEICSGIQNREKRYKLEKQEEGYLLSTVEEKALSRKIKKLYKKRLKNKDFILILQKILIDPHSFRPLFVSIEDVEEELGVSVNYKDFRDFGMLWFPEKVIFNLYTDKSKSSLEIKFSKLEFGVDVEPNFRISSKYKRIEQLD